MNDRILRLLILLGGLSPLFVLWSWWFILTAVVPGALLCLRVWIAKKRSDKREIVVYKAISLQPWNGPAALMALLLWGLRPPTDRAANIVTVWRGGLKPGERTIAYHLSNTVYVVAGGAALKH